MSTEMMTFEFQGQLVRVTMKNGKPQFVAKDVAEILEYAWSGAATIRHVPECWKGVDSVPTPSGDQSMHVLSEEGLNFFVLRSDKPKALPFQMWLAGDVIPSIRQHGVYVSPAVAASPELMNLDQVIAIAQSVAATAMQTKQAREEARLAMEHAMETKAEVRHIRSELEAMQARADEAQQSLLALPAPAGDVPDLSTRAAVRRLVDAYCTVTGMSQRQAYNILYREVRDRFSKDLKARVRGKKTTALEMAEQIGMIESVYALAYELFGPETRNG